MKALLTPAEAADYLGYSKSTLSDWRYQDRGRIQYGQERLGPAWVDGGGTRCRGYRKADLDAWVERQQVGA